MTAPLSCPCPTRGCNTDLQIGLNHCFGRPRYLSSNSPTLLLLLLPLLPLPLPLPLLPADHHLYYFSLLSVYFLFAPHTTTTGSHSLYVILSLLSLVLSPSHAHTLTHTPSTTVTLFLVFFFLLFLAHFFAFFICKYRLFTFHKRPSTVT